jgi:hypothetical protein
VRPFARSHGQQIAAWPQAASGERFIGADGNVGFLTLSSDSHHQAVFANSEGEETLLSKLSDSPC